MIFYHKVYYERFAYFYSKIPKKSFALQGVLSHHRKQIRSFDDEENCDREKLLPFV